MSHSKRYLAIQKMMGREPHVHSEPVAEVEAVEEQPVKKAAKKAPKKAAKKK